jgi:leader peptidase (prepilin peptidase) / N-methyltransferase
MVLPAPWIWPLVAAPFAGSFLGVVIHRLPRGRGLLLARSECENCGRVLRPWELVPIVSWLALGGRCSGCHARIRAFNLLIELVAILVALGPVLVSPTDAPWLWISCGLGWTTLALGWIDWECYQLPDALVLPLIVAGLAVTAILNRSALVDHALATAVGYVSLQLLNAGYQRFRGYDGLGQGDTKLFAACGAWAGLAALPFILLLGALAGLGIAALRAFSGETLSRRTRIPFGTCLAFALWVEWLAVGLVT